MGSGMSFEGKPGAQSSYAIGCNGYQYNTVSRESIPHQLKNLEFKQGDTIGVGWDGKQYQSIYFTKNGQLLLQTEYAQIGFDNVQGQFFPMIWMQSNRSIVEVNFGQKPFLFAFEENKIDQKWLSEMEAANDGKQEMSETEMIRRSRAEELVMMMGSNYPLELAVVALENCSDNLELAAVWLLDNGAKELDRFFEETLKNTLIHQGDDEEEKDDEKEAVHNIYDENGRINLMLWLNEEFNDNAKSANSAKTTSNLLDDEIDARLPVGLSLNEITAHNHNLRGREEEKKEEKQSSHSLNIGIGSIRLN